MPYDLYDYVSASGRNEFKRWMDDLQKKELSKLKAKIDMLAQDGDELFPSLLTNTEEHSILKLRIKGNVHLRPLLCRGPVSMEIEYTLLHGAKEVGDEWEPSDAPRRAEGRRQEVIKDPDNRRMKHE